MITASNYFLIAPTLGMIFTIPINLSYAQVFTSDIDAAFLSETDNKLYLLKGDSVCPSHLRRGRGCING